MKALGAKALDVVVEDLNQPRLAVDLRDFLDMQFPPREWIVRGLIQQRDTCMVHGYRGIGKTNFVHGVALATASGGPFLRYETPSPKGVLLVDGEMPREALQERLASMVASMATEPTAIFRLIAADLLDDPLPSLASQEGQTLVERELEDIDLIIFDNVSTLFSSGVRENDAESWDKVQPWLLSLRRHGYSVLLVDHEGKGANRGARGTSKKEDVLSQVIQLKRSSDYTPELGARFEVHLTKARGVYGAEAEPFEAELTTDPDGRAVWAWRPLEDAKKRQVLALYRDGVTKQRDIAAETGLGLGTVNRKIKQLREEGEID